MYNSECILPTPVSGPAPSLPQIPSQFTVHVEATFQDKNSTMLFIEYYDFDNNRGKLRQLSKGVTTDYFYDYGTNELLVVSPDDFTCTVQRLSSSSHMFLLGDNNGHIFSPAAVLRFSTETGSPWVYQGKGQERGMNVNQWTNCLHWPPLNTSIQVVWKFVDTTLWTSAMSMSDVPVLCHVTGRVYSNNQQYRTFEHLYEFVHFIPNLPSDAEEIFQTPGGVVCLGRKNTKLLPVLPHVLSYVGETLNQQRKSITYTTERYDTRSRIVTYTFRGYTSGFSDRYGSNPLSVVHDFNTGTEYVLDLLRGNCTISTLTATPDVAKSYDMVALRLRDVAGMLNLDGNFTYQGQRNIRGIPCDVWITQKPALDIFGETVNSTYEWAFSTPDWTYQYGSSGVSSIPIQVTYTLNDDGSRQSAVTNVYDFVGGDPDILDGFNLDPCFVGLPRNNVVFAVSRVYRTLLDYFKTQVRHAVRHSIAAATGISPLRIANIEYAIRNTSMTVSFDLLSVPRVHSAVQQPVEQVSLEDATQAFTDALDRNLLVIQLTLQSGEPTYMVPDPGSVQVRRYNQVQVVSGSGSPTPPFLPTPTPGHTSTPTPPTPASSQGSLQQQDVDGLCGKYATRPTRGYSSGALAGSAIALGIVGAGLGVLTHRYLPRPE